MPIAQLFVTGLKCFFDIGHSLVVKCHIAVIACADRDYQGGVVRIGHIKLSALGIQTKTEETMWRFNSVFLGKGEYYNEQYSIVRTPKDRDAVRPLLSAIFRNRPFTQDALKESLVSAVMSSNQMDSEGIDLTSHKNNLKDFTWRYSDIRKMSVPARGGKTAVQPIADEIFSLADAYYESKERRSEIPSLLKFSLSATETKASSLEALVLIL